MAKGTIAVRRVGFRNGTDDELAAMHVVEREIEAERWPDRAPQPLGRYIAFARSLPSQFDDHTWLAETEDGRVVGYSACWSDAAGDPRVMECYVYVRPSWRRLGIGWQLSDRVIKEARQKSRSVLVWATYDSAPAGASFSQRLGGSVARVNRNSALHLRHLDRQMLRSWIEDGPGQKRGYQLDFWQGPYPPDLLEDAVQFHHIMNTAPRDALEVGDTTIDPEQVADIDRHLVDSGRTRWTYFVRSPEGTCVGGTEMTFADWEPAIAFQENTAIRPDHRGLGLAKWAKAAMLARIQKNRPDIEVVRTGNAFSNEPMLAINVALGFEDLEVRTEWQAQVNAIVDRSGRAISSPDRDERM